MYSEDENVYFYQLHHESELHIEPENEKSFKLWSKNVGAKCSGAVSIDHYCSKSCCSEIKDK